MHRLLTAIGLSWMSAWIGGLIFALADERVPASLQVLQYSNLFLPLAALCLMGLRRKPSWSRALAFGVSYLAALFSSYYMAVIASLLVVLWFAMELLRSREKRWAFTAWTVAIVAVSAVLLAVFSAPYFRQRVNVALLRAAQVHAATVDGTEPLQKAAIPPPLPDRLVAMVRTAMPRSPVTTLLMVVGVATGCWYRRWFAVCVGLLFSAAGVLLIHGGGAMLVAWFPWLGFLRSRFRFLVIIRFGNAVLAAVGVDGLRRALPPIAGHLLVACTAFAILRWPGRDPVPSLDEIRAFSTDKAAYEFVARVSGGEGPLLELPVVGGPYRDRSPDSMTGATIHGLPLVMGYSGYPAPQGALLIDLVQTLQMESADVVDDLVDVTHLRWLLVRPESDWQSPRQRPEVVARLSAYPGAGPRYESDGWTLQRIDRQPAHPNWFAALARGPAAGESLLGAKLAPLDALAGRLSPSTDAALLRAPAGWLIRIPIVVVNRDTVDWPAVSPYGATLPGQVYLEARWSAPGYETSRSRRPLRRDVPAGESMNQALLIPTPREPGAHELEVALRQYPDASGKEPEPLSFRLPVIVEPRAWERAPGRPARKPS